VTSATHLILLRHGEAEGNRELRYLGTTDAPLTPEGERQAEQLAHGLAGYPLAAIYTSPLLRAQRTAAIVGAAFALRPVIEPALREQNFGAWENRTRAEVHAEAPERLAAWERGEGPPPDGESLVAVYERVVALADRLATLHANEMVALASHVGPIKALVAAALQLPPTGAHRMWLDTASICVVDWRRDEDGRSSGMLRVFNVTAHLDPPARWLRR
jgi:probable phosphoglycerate mutase